MAAAALMEISPFMYGRQEKCRISMQKTAKGKMTPLTMAPYQINQRLNLPCEHVILLHTESKHSRGGKVISRNPSSEAGSPYTTVVLFPGRSEEFS